MSKFEQHIGCDESDAHCNGVVLIQTITGDPVSWIPAHHNVHTFIDTVHVEVKRPITGARLQDLRELCSGVEQVRPKRANCPKWRRVLHIQQPSREALEWLRDELGSRGTITRVDVSLDLLVISEDAAQRLQQFFERYLMQRWRGKPKHKRKFIDLDSYITYCIANQEYLDTIVNLDVIPGEFGRQPNVSEVEESANQSYSNLKRMEEHGLSPIPVFHQGERWYWLERLIDENYLYIGISPANDRTTEQKRIWLDEVFELLPSSIKTHAYGMTQVDLLFRYPFYSCDSTTWHMAAGKGGVMVPKQHGYNWSTWYLKPLFNRQPDIIKVTEGTRGAADHYDKLPKIVQGVCRGHWAMAGFSLGELKHDYVARTAVNARMSHHIERRLIRHHKGRFGRWIYAVNLSPVYSAALSGILRKSGHYDPDEKPDEWEWVDRTKPLAPDEDWYEDEDGEFYGLPKGFFQPHRLMSYWEIMDNRKDQDPDFIRNYVSTGLIEGIKLTDKNGNPFEPRSDPRGPPV